MAETYPIRTITADEFGELTRVPTLAFGQVWPAEGLEHERKLIEFDRTIAALDGKQMVGSASSHSVRLTVPGGSAAAAGITLVSVLPTYRRRGILTSLMDWLLADAARRGEALAILFATEASIYARFGFGMASMHQRLRFSRGEGKLAAGPESAGTAAAATRAPRLREAEPLAARTDLASVFDAVLPCQPGTLARDARWWDHILGDPPVMRPSGFSPLRCIIAEDEAGPRGYALYRTQLTWGEDQLAAGTLRIRELTATDPAATAALWADLLSRDLTSEVIAQMRPIDDPVLAMLADPRRARPAPADGLWLRLVDLRAALCQRRYSAAIDLVLEVSDQALDSNAGRWRLRTGGPDSGEPAACDRTGDPADLRLSVQALGAGFLGAPRVGQLAAAGQIAELTPGSLARLGTAMSWERAPFSPMIF
jgi:predicted acetyltransferase